MLFCDHCGAENSNTASSCVYCHQSLPNKPIISTRQGQQQVQVARVHPPRQTVTSSPSLTYQSNLLQQRYRIVETIGEGGYASIYRAFDRQNKHRSVAIKAINLKGLSADEMIDATATFNSEIAIMSTLHHKAVPQLHDHFTDSEHWYIVMDFIEGQTLEQYFSTLTSSSFREVGTTRTFLHIALELCEVLAYMHNKSPRIIYRDLKPSNIILKKDNHIALVDFGTARYFKRGKAHDTLPLGSPGYAAPEQYGKAQTTPKSDIYSLGALLHQMLTGEDPSQSPFSFSPITRQTPGLSPKLVELIERMTSLDTKLRPATMREVKMYLLGALSTLDSSNPPAAPVPHSLTTRPAWSNMRAPIIPMKPVASSPQQQPAKINRRRVLILGGGAITLAAFFGAQYLGNSHASAPPAITSTQNTDSKIIDDDKPDDTIPMTSNFTRIEKLATWTLPATATAFADAEDSAFSIVACTDNTIYVFYSHHSITYTGHESGPIKYISHSHHDTYIASCAEGDATIHVWDATTGELYRKVRAPASVTALSLYGDVLAIACNDTVYTYNLSKIDNSNNATASPKRIYHEAGNHITALRLQVPSDNNQLYLCYGCENGSVSVWQDDKITTQYKHTGQINAIACWDSFMASASSDYTVQVYNLTNTDGPVTIYHGHAPQRRAVQKVTWLTYDMLASTDRSGSVHIWSLRSPITNPNDPVKEPLVITRADPRFDINAYIVNCDYFLTCITSPQEYSIYRIF
ncbi:serine/threonine-protein kinase [Ktedonospora formicarum]|uniref:non-specific serine/threonine protein kinase n=1 Tax=Ktedonospora formicarum TaxID=2778364 RepID=A0A8J3I5Z9_9CHLR|nr:serine/threonine-protein kinase [Ktedonospora formicarum]GHO46518.1 hypothetical protein KSX_46810 [Ktedonospora formicarum]